MPTSNSVERAAWLCKADLVTDMVGEFPELQGPMGRYYAQHDRDRPGVRAIAQHYSPRFAGDPLPGSRSRRPSRSPSSSKRWRGCSASGRAPDGATRIRSGCAARAIGWILRISSSRKRLPLPVLGLDGPRVPGVSTRYRQRKPSPRTSRAFFYERLRAPPARPRAIRPTRWKRCSHSGPERIDLVPEQLAAVKAFEGAARGRRARLPPTSGSVNILRKSEIGRRARRRPGPAHRTAPSTTCGRRSST